MPEINKSPGFLLDKNYRYTYEVIGTAEKLCTSIFQLFADTSCHI